MTRLDPAGPAILDLRALHLQRRAGSLVTVERTIPGPDDLGVALAHVPPGSPMQLEARLESVLEGVLVTGTIDYQVVGECARCLDPLDWEEAAEFRELFRYPVTDHRGVVIDEAKDGDDPLPFVQDDCIDLEPTLRDAIVPQLPLAPTCRADCGGLCATCGIRLDDAPGHRHEQADPRWAALEGLRIVEPPGG